MITAPDRTRFVATYGHVFEHSPWVVERAWAARPFTGPDALFNALTSVVEDATPEQKLNLLRAHPELGVCQALTAASDAEQSGAGLKQLSAEEFARFAAMNTAYREKFGFPFIICVRRHNKASIFAAFARRLNHNSASEFREALTEVFEITRLRLADLQLQATA